ncbi:hypothetical protein SOPP22_04690 [Shewanella sp. OPT22]|nr:hypothetical protein SOPP22_04690 [Shewanella sp. OPT22]
MMKITLKLLAVSSITLFSCWASAKGADVQLSSGGPAYLKTFENCPFVSQVTDPETGATLYSEGLGCKNNPAKFSIAVSQADDKKWYGTSTAWDICQKTKVNVPLSPFLLSPGQLVPEIANSIKVINHCNPGEMGYAELHVFASRDIVNKHFNKDAALVLFTTNSPFKEGNGGVQFYLAPSLPNEAVQDGWPIPDESTKLKGAYTHDQNKNVTGLKAAYCNWDSSHVLNNVPDPETGKTKSIDYGVIKVIYKVTRPVDNVAISAAWIEPDTPCSKVNSENNYNN